MIKNTIIVILLLLLLITFYAYMCLSGNMVDFQKERMEYIVKKEAEIKSREHKLLTTEECNNNLNKYKTMINKVSTDLEKVSTDINNLTKYTAQVENEMTGKHNKSDVYNEIKKEEHFENFDTYNELDKPIEDGLITALD